MMTARGRNRRCLFCFQLDKDCKAEMRGVRFRSIGSVLAEMGWLAAQGYREIKFLDDSFAADHDRALALAQEITRLCLCEPGGSQAPAGDEERRLLGDPARGRERRAKNLNALRKGTTLEQIRAAVRTAKDAGLVESTPFLFGIPGVIFEEGLQTIAFAIELDPDLANFHCVTRFPGTPLCEHHQRYGTVSGDLRDYAYQGAAFVPYTMRREDIERLRQLAFRRFYSRARRF